jgi:PqqD family protein of HPr-rel-A system
MGPMNAGHFSNPLWAGPPANAIIIVPIDALTMIYDRRSGQTHVVTSPVPEILALMGAEPLSLSQILASLQAQFDVGVGDEARQSLMARLDELVQLGLVKPQ